MNEPWFKVSRWHGRFTGQPIHPKGWAALLAAILAPQLPWLLRVLFPGIPPILVMLAMPVVLGLALWWLFRLMLRRGQITDHRN